MRTRFLLILPLLAAACAAEADDEALRARLDELHASLATANESIDALRSELTRLRAELQVAREEIEVVRWPRPRFPSPAMAAVNGVVTGVDEDLNIVTISVGADDRVAVGYTCKVFRGNEFIGMLVVDRVGPDWAAGHMVLAESKAFPERGDDVATKL